MRLISRQNNVLLKWTIFLLLPCHCSLSPSAFSLRYLVRKSKTSHLRCRERYRVQVTLQMLLEEKWQADLLITSMNMRAPRTTYCSMILAGSFGGQNSKSTLAPFARRAAHERQHSHGVGLEARYCVKTNIQSLYTPPMSAILSNGLISCSLLPSDSYLYQAFNSKASKSWCNHLRHGHKIPHYLFS
jgi:hypothetical protein